MAKIRNKSKKLLLTGILAGAFAIINLGVIGYAFTIGQPQEFGAGELTVISDNEYIYFGAPTVTSDFVDITYEGFNNGATKTPTITATYNVEYVFANELSDERNVEIYFTLAQTSNNDEHGIDPELDLSSYLDKISVTNIDYTTTVENSPTDNAGMDNSCYMGTSMDQLRMIGDEGVKTEITLKVIYTFDFEDVEDFAYDIYYKMNKQDVQLEVGLFTYIPQNS